MIRLENLSKYYHNDGNVVLGLRKINLELKLGEFVAITGESGSGKSTLLNVISGLDSYEDGEMYINNEQTSYFDEVDWENYRRQYIGFVFQNYNLIDSYNVLENVEAALIIAGVPREERRTKAINILNRVGLGKHLKHKATKLSGGEKQRLSIARALAKDAPIIVADEPTGNLDSQTGEQIIELLHEISKEKLVIVVTHNYEIVQKYVTRKIRVYDGEIVENKEIEIPNENNNIKLINKEIPRHKKALIFSSLNLKNQPKRTIFMLIVTCVTTFIVSLLLGQLLISELNADYSYGNNNQYFPYATPDRIVVKKVDGTNITNEDYNRLLQISNVNCIVKEDIILDLNAWIDVPLYYVNGGITSIRRITEKDLVYGRMPEKDNEIVINSKAYENTDQTIRGQLNINFNKSIGSYKFDYVTIVGYVNESYPYQLYLTDNLLQKIYNLYFFAMEEHQVSISLSEPEPMVNEIGPALLIPDYSLQDDEVRLPYRFVSQFEDYYVKMNVTISGINKTFKIKRGYADADYSYFVTVNVSPNVYKEYLTSSKDYYQHSVYVKKVDNIDKTISAIKDLNYYAFSPYYAGMKNSFDIGIIISKILIIIFSLIILFCIYILSFLVIKTIFNSKKRDYAILRSVGLDAKTIKFTILFEIVLSFVVAYILLIIAIILTKVNRINNFYQMFDMYRWYHYIILLAINILLGVFASLRYNKKMMEKSLVAQAKVE